MNEVEQNILTDTRGREFSQFQHLAAEPGEHVCYLYHLDPAYEHAEHYLGTTDDLERRDSEHGGPDGARLLEVQKQAGGSWHLTRTWIGDGIKEQALKAQSGKRYCPDCVEHPKPGMDTQNRWYRTRSQRRADQYVREANEKEAQYREATEKETEEAPASNGRRNWLTCGEMQERLTRAKVLKIGGREAEEMDRHVDRLVRQWAKEHDERLANPLPEPEPEPLPRILEPGEEEPHPEPGESDIPHPHPGLAARGWQRQGGIWQRSSHPHHRQPDRELEMA